MEAISGTRRAMKEMADGTIRVQVDIDPACRAQFLSMFPNIDMPVAIAPLVADFEQRKPEEKPKGGELAKLSGMLCQQPEFWRFADVTDANEAAAWIRHVCGVTSRSELDHNPEAASRFHTEIRKPFAGVAA